MIETLISYIRPLIPRSIFRALQPPYHFLLAFLGAVIYRFPSKKLIVIGVTGTKGKSTTVELINAVFEEAGNKTVLANTIRFKVLDTTRPNLYKMTMPGRFFIQKLLRDGLNTGATHAFIEISSEATLQYRERFLSLDALVFTNLAPEHLESHGSYEKYLKAKLKIGERVLKNGKEKKLLVTNGDDPESKKFEDLGIKEVRKFSLRDTSEYETNERTLSFKYKGDRITAPLTGVFNMQNILAALEVAEGFNVPKEKILRAFEKFKGAPGRVEFIDAGQPFSVVVDYAHTPDSLEALYKAFDGKHKVCILSGTGGGRDRWKRPKMGAIADQYCDEIILTDEDPYDEDPTQIIEEIKKGITEHHTSTILDRREAIREGVKRSKENSVLLITGKGTDPYIMGKNGKKTPWSDAKVAKEEIEKELSNARTS